MVGYDYFKCYIYNYMVIIIWLHFIADFILQWDSISTTKWNSLKSLGTHCTIYGIPFLYFGLNFALVTVGAHFIVDFISSKLTHHYRVKEQYHWFFVVIGWDQAIHMSILILTWKYMIGDAIVGG